MVRKGNLLYNGSFETGDTEGWTIAPVNNVVNEATIDVDNSNQKSGNYCGKLIAGGTGFYGKGYDKLFDFEEYAAYYFEMWAKDGNTAGIYPFIEIYDDRMNIINHYYIGYWAGTTYGLIRGLITNFGLGRWGRLFLGAYGMDANTYAYFDNVLLMPVNKLSEWSFVFYKPEEDITSDKYWYPGILIPRPAKIRSVVEIGTVSGTDPELDIELRINSPIEYKLVENTDHVTISSSGTYGISYDSQSFGIVGVKYDVSGTDPKFPVKHWLEISLM